MNQHLTWMACIGMAASAAGFRLADGAESQAPSPTEPVIVRQADDGVVLLHGSAATIRGTTLRWEPQEKKRTLGFWKKVDDAAEWTFTVTRPGEFDIEVLQGCGKGQGGSDMLVTLDPDHAEPQRIPFVVEDTGGFQEFKPRMVGRISITAPGDHVIRVKPERIAKAAACDIRQMRLVPAR